MTLATGTTLGHYEIIRSVGAGGMGEVYCARDARLGRDVAIKVLPAHVSDDPGRLKRFEQEARAVGALNHPGILSVFDVGEHAGGPYMVTELLDGTTLREKLRAGPLPTPKAIEYGVQIAQALAAAHDQGIVHRDLKPENLFVTKDGRIKILDFGLAKAIEPSAVPRETTLTAGGTDSGVVIGTAGYMAPEQVRGKAIDHRADLFALGVVMYEMISGRAPFAEATPIDRALATLNIDPAPLSQTGRPISPALEATVRRALEKSPEERFHSARDLAFALKTLSSSSSDNALRPPINRRSNLRRLSVIAAGAVVAIVGGIAIGRYFGRSSTTPVSSPVAATPPKPVTFQPITYRYGRIMRARFGPDEHTIIFGARFDGDDVPRIFSATPGGVEPRALSDRSATLYDVSATGEMAMITPIDASYRLARAPLAGGEPRELATNVVDASWGSTDSLMALTWGDGGFRLEYPLGTVLVSESAYLVKLPRVAPDGMTVAFASGSALVTDNPMTDGVFNVEIVDRGGHRRTILRSSEPIGSLVWRPDGREIWFTVGRQLRAVSIDGRERTVSEFPGIMTIEAMGRDGRALLVRHDDSHHLTIHLRGSSVSHDLAWQDGSFSADLSVDGTLLLFGEAFLTKGNTEVYVRPTSGGPAIHIGTGVPIALSQDKKWALVAADGQKLALSLIPIGAGESRAVKLGPIVEFNSAAFLSGDERIILDGHEAGKPWRIWIVDLSGSVQPRAIGPDDLRLMAPSPTSTDAVVTQLRDKHEAILSLLTGTLQPLFDTKIEYASGWSEDGRSIYVGHYHGDFESDLDAVIERLDLTTRRRTSWLRLDFGRRDNKIFLTFGMTPDAQTYEYDWEHLSSQLFLVEGLQ